MSTASSSHTAKNLAEVWCRRMNVRKFGRGRYTPNATLRKHGVVFQRMADFGESRNVNMKKFIEFCIMDLGVTEPSLICTKSNMVRFLGKTMLDKAKKDRYERFMSDVEKVALDAIESGCKSTEEYFNKVFSRHLLGIKFVTGKISSVCLASLPQFGYLYSKLVESDPMTADTLSELKDVAGELGRSVQESFLYMGEEPVGTITLTDNVIREKQKKQEQKTIKKESKDHVHACQ